MTKALVLGGAGFVGYHIIKHLVENRPGEVVIVDDLSRGQLDQDLNDLLGRYPSIQLQTADLVDENVYDGLGGPFEQVYLLAGVVGVSNVQNAPARVLSTNIAIISNTLHWLAKMGCGRLLFVSTSEAYADSVKLGLAPVPTSENVPLSIADIQSARSTYALTKMLGESAVTHFAKEFGFEALIVRLHNVYGPRMGMSHVVPEVIERINRRMDPLPVYGVTQTRAFCYVSDAVKACLSLMDCQLDGPQIVNVGNDQEEVSIGELVQTLFRVSGFHPQIQVLPSAPGGVSRRLPDIGKLRALTGFRPEVNLAEGLALTWHWYHKRLDSEEAPRSALTG